MTDHYCKSCKQTLPETKFKLAKYRNGSQYRVNVCYACVYKKTKDKQKIYTRNYYLSHKAENYARSVRWRQAHREQYNLTRKKWRMKKALEALGVKHG